MEKLARSPMPSTGNLKSTRIEQKALFDFEAIQPIFCKSIPLDTDATVVLKLSNMDYELSSTRECATT